MDLAPVLARLKSQLTGFCKIGGAADLAALGNGLVPTPALFLFPAEEQAAAPEFAGDNIARVAVSFSIVLAVSNKASAQGEGALGGLEAYRDQVKAALHGWVPAAGYDLVSFSGGRLMPFDNATLFWMDDFKTAYFMRSPQ